MKNIVYVLIICLVFTSCIERSKYFPIVILDGIEMNNNAISQIENKIFGINDDEGPFEEVQNNELKLTASGLLIILKPDIKNTEEIEVIATHEDVTFKNKYKLETIRSFYDDVDLGFTASIKIENKYLVNKKGIWHIAIFSDNSLILEEDITINIKDSMFYEQYSDSPFEISEVRELLPNHEYNYQIYNNEKSIIVIYESSNDFTIFTPILLIEPTKNNNGQSVKIKWNKRVKNKSYYITHYQIDDIPTSIKKMGIFNQKYFTSD